MTDIQNQTDTREIPLQKVGVKGLEYPILVLDKANKTQHTSCKADLFVNLPHNFKGTHMSRFIEIFHKYHEDLSMKKFLLMLEEVCKKLNAQKAFGTITFPFYIEKKAPVSGQSGMMCYQCSYEGKVELANNAETDEKTEQFSKNFFVSVSVPVTTLCPCSKAISQNGAHNQRGIVKAKVQGTGFFWIEDIINLIEESASCAVYSLLKRKDEKFVTEQAYENPRFVEDLVREVYTRLKAFSPTGVNGTKTEGNKFFSWFSVEAENFESIHNHSAYAYTELDET